MKQVIRALAGATIAVLALSACGLGAAPAPTATLLPGQTPQVVLPTAVPGDPCANEYFPVRAGAIWSYQSSGSPSGAFGFRKSVGEVQPGQFAVSTEVDEKTFHENWQCRPEGLVAQSMILMDATSLLALNKFNEVQVSNISGLNLPPAITPGAAWSLSYDIQATEKDQTGAVISTMTGQVIISFTATGKESVTVPAGNFDAMAISMGTVINFTVTQPGGTVSQTATSNYIVWLAPGVGWVKSSGTGTLGSSDYFETIELQAFTIP